MKIIVDNSEKYFDKWKQQAKKITQQKKIKLKELKTFLGILVAMGITKIPIIDDYWSNDILLHNQFIA